MSYEPPPEFANLSEAEIVKEIELLFKRKRLLIKQLCDLDSEIISRREEIRRRHPELHF